MQGGKPKEGLKERNEVGFYPQAKDARNRARLYMACKGALILGLPRRHDRSPDQGLALCVGIR
jgi:hypothetical protein